MKHMARITHAPDQPLNEPVDRFEWELEETLVDRHNRLPNRIRRFLTSGWLWITLSIILVASLLDADVMRTVLSLLGIALTLAFAIVYILVQFIAMFWFVSRTRQYTVMPGAEGVGFDDYRGQPEILEQALQVVTLLRGVKAFEEAGGEPLNGLLLEGPPGTGKTWLAQAISTEAGVPFFYVDTSSLQGMFMGVSNLKVSRVYGKARKAAQEYGAAVIFFDEIDTIGSRGGVSQVGGGTNHPLNPMAGMFGGNMGLLSTLLIEMSGFSLEHGWRARFRRWLYKTFLRVNPPAPHKRVLTIGATNRMSALDPALLRPGRFDKKIRVDAPDMQGRREIFEYYLSKMAHDESMEPGVLASETPGYTPADIKYLLNETLRYALFSGRRYMTYHDFQRAKPEHEMGLRQPLKHMSREGRERMAYYWAGRATAVRLFLPEHRIARISIARQGSAFGHVSHYPAREAYQGMRTKAQYMNMLRVLAAGRAAEIEFCGVSNQTVSANNDFREIRGWLTMMARAGMFGSLGGALIDGVTPEMSAAMDETLQDLVREARVKLREHATIVRALVALLLEKEELVGNEIEAFFDPFGLHTPRPTLIRDGEERSLLDAGAPLSPAAGLATDATTGD
jgi:cell division protease FtsH